MFHVLRLLETMVVGFVLLVALVRCAEARTLGSFLSPFVMAVVATIGYMLLVTTNGRSFPYGEENAVSHQGSQPRRP